MTPWLDRPLTTVAFLWRLERRDGLVLGFTSHDRGLWRGDTLYRAAPGMLPSAVSLSDGLEIDTLDVKGALTAQAINAGDLAAGRWDGATVRLFAADWEDPAAPLLPLIRGELGEVGTVDAAFTAELAGPTALIERPAVESTSPECRADLGDRRCRIDMTGRTRTLRVAAVAGQTLTLDADEPTANAYGYGTARPIDGAACGLSLAILRSEGATVTLRRAPPVAIPAGDRIELREGCDRSFATCRARFANARNFRGEPYLPGMDLLTRYPGA